MYKPLVCCVVLLALVGCISTQDDNMGPICYECRTQGESCKDNLMVPIDNVCVDKTYCKSDTQTCTTQLGVGQPCDQADSCLDGHCDMGTRTCQPMPGFGPTGGKPGETCQADSDCLFKMTCSNNMCKGSSLGQTCDATTMCSPGLYCFYDNKPTGTCANVIELDQQCDVTIAGVCGQINSCLPKNPTTQNGICTSPATTVAAGLCALTNKLTCPDNTACVPLNGSETTENIGKYIGRCQAIPTSTYKLCNSTKDCPTFEQCVCNTNATIKGDNVCVRALIPNPDGLRTIGSTLETCITRHCGGVFVGLCVETNCLEEYCAKISVEHEMQLSLSKLKFPQCMVNDLSYKTATPSACVVLTKAKAKENKVAIAVGVSFGVIALLIIGIFLFMKRKEIYEKVFGKPYPFDKPRTSTSIFDDMY